MKRVAMTLMIALMVPMAGAEEMADMRERLVQREMELQLLQQQLEIRDLRSQLGSMTTAPELVGIVSNPDGTMTAEFRRGSSVYRASEGDWVSDEWRVVSVQGNGVEVHRRDSSKARFIAFGAPEQSEPSQTGAAVRVGGAAVPANPVTRIDPGPNNTFQVNPNRN